MNSIWDGKYLGNIFDPFFLNFLDAHIDIIHMATMAEKATGRGVNASTGFQGVYILHRCGF